MTTVNTIRDNNQNPLSVTSIGKVQDWQNETTTYYFFVGKETYGVSDQNGELSIVDIGNYPVNTDDTQNIHLKQLFSFVTDELRAE